MITIGHLIASRDRVVSGEVHVTQKEELKVSGGVHVAQREGFRKKRTCSETLAIR